MNVIVIGAGFAGTTIARQFADAGHQVFVYDVRQHIAGNAFDTVHPCGIRYHAYGPHLFHTNNKRVWDYLNAFGQWVPYQHRVKALLLDGTFVTLPVNRETKEIVGEENIIETFYRPYSEKMWGMKLEDIDPTILARVKVRDDDNEFYFPDDEYQGLPVDGYTRLIENMLDHPNIKVSLGVYMRPETIPSDTLVFNSSAIDEWYDYKYGELPYRSIAFEHYTSPCYGLRYPTATTNYTHTGPVTRVTEWKHLPHHNTIENNPVTLLTYEIPCCYKENRYERYYPVKDPDGKNREIYQRYKALADEDPNMHFIGRCGSYVYMDMHQAVNQALNISERFL